MRIQLRSELCITAELRFPDDIVSLPQITIDTDAECDSAGEAKITELNIPLLYDTLTFDMENLDKAFDTVIQGILVILLETQNMLAVAALRALIAQSVGSLMCTWTFGTESMFSSLLFVAKNALKLAI